MGSAAAERGQALLLMLALLAGLALAAGALGSLGAALLGKGRHQRAADLAAVSAARSMSDNFARLFEPPFDARGRPNRRHVSKSDYLERARSAAISAARANGLALERRQVSFPDAGSFAPLRVRVRLRGRLDLEAARRAEEDVFVAGEAEAELLPSADVTDVVEHGGGYDGPLAYRQGRPMRPDVARAFDRIAAAARTDGVSLVITSAYRSDAEQARLFARHPDPRWVAPPGKSLHRLGTELDLGPRAAYGWLAHNARRFHFVQRYSWEPWH